MKIRTLLIDDSPETLETSAILYNSHQDMQIVGAVGSIAEAKETLKLYPIDMVSIDIRLGEDSGFELCSYVHSTYPDIYITMCSVEDHEDNRTIAKRCGAEFFLSKPLRYVDICDLVLHFLVFRTSCTTLEDPVNQETRWGEILSDDRPSSR